jgi:hypothetical protein
MASQKQIAANRRNAQRSTGPRTSEGKIASSRNSFRSGIYADRETILPTEDPAALDELKQEYYDHYQPSSPTERCLVDCLISDEWLLRRFRRVEGELLTECNSEISQSAERFCIGAAYKDNDATLERLQRRINATRRSYLKTLEVLESLRAAAAPETEPPALGLRSPAPIIQPLPAPIGFVPPSGAANPGSSGLLAGSAPHNRKPPASVGATPAR